MKLAERRNKIVELVNQEGSVTFGRLKQALGAASEMTLRRDLEALDKEGRIIRVHGGARSVDVVIGTDDLLLKRSMRNMQAKDVIARKAVGLLRANTAIYLDSGSTATLLARLIPDERYIIFTSGLSCVQEMLHLTQSQVHVLGGRLNPASQSVCSARSLKELAELNFQTAFLGVTGFTLENGFTCGTEDECQLKRAAIRSADVVVALMDASKVGVCSTFTYAMPQDVDIIVTDDAIDKQVRKRLEDAGITVL